jgi:hypothetical protein
VEGWKEVRDYRRDLMPAIYSAFTKAFSVLKVGILDKPMVYFGGRFYAWALLNGVIPSVRVDFRVDGQHYTAFTAGTPCIPRDLWEAMISYSTLFHLLVDGRDSTGLKDIENECYKAITEDNSLPIADDLFH